jgi:hypothetical protein
MEEKIGEASLRDAAIGTGIAVDKMLALTGQMPAAEIANVINQAKRTARSDANSTISLTRLLGGYDELGSRRGRNQVHAAGECRSA